MITVGMQVTAFLITPAQVELTFEPHAQHVINLTVYNNENTNKNLAVDVLYNWLPASVQQELGGKIVSDTARFQFRPGDLKKDIRITMNLPETLSAGGKLEIRVAVTEEATDGVVGSRASNVMRVLLFVPDTYVKPAKGDQGNQTASQGIISSGNTTRNATLISPSSVQPRTNASINKTLPRQKPVQSPTDTVPPQTKRVEFVLPEDHQQVGEQALLPHGPETPTAEEQPSFVQPSPINTPMLPLLAALISGIALLLIGGAMILPELLIKQKPLMVPYFFAANVLQGQYMPISILIENANLRSIGSVYFRIVVKDSENNFVKQLRHGPLTLASNYRGTINLECRTDDMQPGNYLFELTVNAPDQMIKRFSHAQVYL